VYLLLPHVQMNKVYILLGSNIGNSLEQITIAKKNIAKKVGKIESSSSIYVTAAWGNTNQPDFLNQVIIVATTLSAASTLTTILGIENSMGRIRTEKNAPRIIDIDILFFNTDVITTPSLTVPHPEIANRKFVLIPLTELTPSYKHPILHKTVKELLHICTDDLAVKKK
jgi:2-amino-4-hydroxy-6-hydroxymethyldihydropteridine diphosphokinase